MMTSTAASVTASELPQALPVLVSTTHEHLLFVEGTLEDFYAIEEQKADYIERIIVMHSPASLSHERTFLRVITALYTVAEARALGTVLGSRSLIALSEDHRFEPDIVFIASDNAGVWTQGDREFRGVPELVVEILSPSTRHYDLNVKRTLYQHYGVAEIVFIDQREREIIIDTINAAGSSSAGLSEPHYTSTALRESGSARSSVVAGFTWTFDAVF
jgi:Uma2 family endonuclease